MAPNDPITNFDPSKVDLDALAQQAGSVGNQPAPEVDYDALAKQAGSVGSEPVTQPTHYYDKKTKQILPVGQPAGVDYDALAKQAGSVGSEAPGEEAAPEPQKPTTFWGKIKDAFLGPGTAAGAPLDEDKAREFEGISDILHGDVAQGWEKIKRSESDLSPEHVAPGSAAEYAIRLFNPDFHGTAPTDKYLFGLQTGAAQVDRATSHDLVKVGELISALTPWDLTDKKKHPIGTAMAEIASGLTSPENLAIMAGSGGLGLVGESPQALKSLGTMNKLLSAGFGMQALQGAYQHSKAFRDAWNAGDSDEALYEFTHTLMSGVMAAQAGTHAGEGSYKVGGKTYEVKPLVQMSPTEERIAKGIAGVVSHAADSTIGFAKDALQGTADRVGASIGKARTFEDATTRVANMLGKKVGPEFQEKVASVSDDLKAIVNADTKNKIKDPKTAADAINQHIQSEIDAPLLREAGATKDDPNPVVPDFQQRLSDHLDKFFNENPGEYGSSEQEEAIKQRIIDRMTRTHDAGNGVKYDREPNLFEAENIRQGLNKSAGDVFETGTSNGYRAASAATADFMRTIIDEAYRDRGVTGVKEARQAEANLIDVRDALYDAQGKFEKQQSVPALLKLFSIGKMAGMIGAVGAHFMSSNFLGFALGAGTIWKTVHEHYSTDIESNIDRMKALAAREKGVKATVPEVGPTPPVPVTPGGPLPPTSEPPSPVAPNMPPRPTPPPPVERPEINHQLRAAIASYFDESTDPSKQTPYKDLLNKFETEFAAMKEQVKAAQEKGQPLTERQQEQWDAARAVNNKIHQERAREDAAMQKENAKAAQKHQRDLDKWEAQNKSELAKQEALKLHLEDQDSQAKLQEEKARVDAIKTDPRMAHSPVMFATEPVQPIEAADGRSSQEAHDHEHGHIMAAVAEGLNPFSFLSETHPDAVEEGAHAQVHIGTEDAKEGFEGVEQKVVTILGGAAFDEVHNGMKLGRNAGVQSDVALARKLLREEGGLSGKSLDKAFDNLYDRAKEHVSNPEALAIVDANKGLREAGLHKNFHMSPGRMEAYAKLLAGAYRNGETPTTETDVEGAAGKREGGPKPGGSAGEQDGSAEEARAEGVRESDEGAAGRGQAGARGAGGVEEGLADRDAQSALKRSYKIEVRNPETGKIEQQTIEAFGPREAAKLARETPGYYSMVPEAPTEAPEQPYSVPNKKPLSMPASISGKSELSTIRHELGHALMALKHGIDVKGMFRHTHPDFGGGRASVRLDTSSFYKPGTRILRPEHAGPVLETLAGGIAADEVFNGIDRNSNMNFTRAADRPQSDAGLMTRYLNQIGITDPEQVSQIMHAAVDAAKAHLSQQHVADVVHENAAFREPGLSSQYHMSPQRLRSMNAEAFRRGATNEASFNPRSLGGTNQGTQVGVPGGEGTAQAGRAEALPAAAETNEVRPRPESLNPTQARERIKTLLDRTKASLADPNVNYDPEKIKADLDEVARLKPMFNQDLGETNALSDNEKGLISTRQPSGKKATEDPLKQQLKIDRNAVESVPGMPEKVAAKIKATPGIGLPKDVTEPKGVIDHFVNHLKENLKDIYNRVDPAKREATAKWYDTANAHAKKLAEKYGLTPQQTSGVIAAMSPQKDWDQNVSLAERTIESYAKHQDVSTSDEMMKRGRELAVEKNDKGELTNPSMKSLLPKIKGKTLGQIENPLAQAAWIRLYDEVNRSKNYMKMDPGTGKMLGTVLTDAGVPRQMAWGGLDTIVKSLSILKDGSRENISNNLGDAHKVRNFYNNIIDPNNPAGHVTIDTHAVAAAHMQPFSGKSPEVKANFGGIGSKLTGMKGLYGIYADAYRQAAAELGIQPRQLQSVTWEAIREEFPDRFKRAMKGEHPKAIQELWKKYDSGETNLEQTRQAVRDYAAQNRKGGGVNLSTEGDLNMQDQDVAAKQAGFLGQKPAAIPPQAAWDAYGPKTAPGMTTRGNISLQNRPIIKNDDGSHSSEYSTSFQDEDGKEVLVPTVVNGKFLTPDGKKPKVGSAAEKAMYRAAWDHYKKTGEHMGKFDTPEHADAYAVAVHNRKQ